MLPAAPGLRAFGLRSSSSTLTGQVPKGGVASGPARLAALLRRVGAENVVALLCLAVLGAGLELVAPPAALVGVGVLLIAAVVGHKVARRQPFCQPSRGIKLEVAPRYGKFPRPKRRSWKVRDT